MNLRRTRTEDPEVNIVSLIDVVLMLLIFFMLTTTFNRESALHIDLPQASGKQMETDRFVLDIAIDREGHLFINQHAVVNNEVETVKRAMRTVLGSHKNPQVVISSDKLAPYQSVITAMDAARQLGLERLTFATKQSNGNSSP